MDIYLSNLRVYFSLYEILIFQIYVLSFKYMCINFSQFMSLMIKEECEV